MPGSMKAAVFLGPGRMEIREMPVPVPDRNEVTIKVEACAICGTDGRIYTHGQKNVTPPHVLGHEIAGTIAECGAGADKWRPGQKTTVVTSVGCGACRFCKDGLTNMCVKQRHIGYYYPGGFAQYVKVPAEAVQGGNILVAPDHLDFPEISLIEPLSCCVNGQEYLSIRDGEAVAIIGAGPIGCMHAELARAKGAGLVAMFDISPERLKLAERFKGVKTFDSGREDMVEKAFELTDGRGMDVIVVACSSGAAQEAALKMAATKARVSLFAGLPKDNPFIKFDANVVHYKEIGVFGAFASHRRQFEEAMEFIASGRVEAGKLVTHRVPLDKIVEGIEIAKSGKGLKVIVEVNK